MMSPTFWRVVFAVVFLSRMPPIQAIENCPMAAIVSIIDKVAKETGRDTALQMQIVRRISEDIYGGSWGVLIVRSDLISSTVHWTIPDHKHRDGTPAFCLHVNDEWQYNVFKTGSVDSEGRISVDEAIRRAGTKDTPNDGRLEEKFNKVLHNNQRGGAAGFVVTNDNNEEHA